MFDQISTPDGREAREIGRRVLEITGELEIWLEGTTKEYTTARTVTQGAKSQSGLSMKTRLKDTGLLVVVEDLFLSLYNADQARSLPNCTGDEMDKVNERLFKTLQKLTPEGTWNGLTGVWERKVGSIPPHFARKFRAHMHHFRPFFSERMDTLTGNLPHTRK